MTTPVAGSPVQGISPATPASTAPTSGPELVEAQRRLAEAESKMRTVETESRLQGKRVKELGAKLTEHGKMTKAFSDAGLSPEDLVHAKLNPEPFFRKLFGDKWYDRVVDLRINGTPPADVIASEMDRRFDAYRQEQEQKSQQAAAEQTRIAEERDQQARAVLTSEASDFLSKSWGDFPIFEGYEKGAVARAISQYQEQHFRKNGGQVVSAKEAAEAIEASEIARAEKVAGIEKYRPKLTEKLKPGSVTSASSSSAGRLASRTSSNDLSGQAPGAKRTSRTDEDRRAAAMALVLGKP